MIEELGFAEQLPIPHTHPLDEEHREFSYVFLDPRVGDAAPLQGRFTEGPSLDGRGEFSIRPAEPHGREPVLAPPDPRGGAQAQQLRAAATASTRTRRGAKTR